jgi:putative FmdB family regulatory protein
MPTYSYECTICDHKFDEFQKMTDEPLTECPKCNGEIIRLIGAGMGILFKGTGFYTTDYRSKEYKDKEKMDTSSISSTKEEKTSTPTPTPTATASTTAPSATKN